MNKRNLYRQGPVHGFKGLSMVVAAIFGSTPIMSMAFSLGQASHHLEIGKPLSIRIPVGSITDEFNPSCVAVSKSSDDANGDNFPAAMKVSMLAGAQPMLLISGPTVKQPIVEFTVSSTCPNTKFERTYLLLPDVGMSDLAAVETDESKALPSLSAVAPQEMNLVASLSDAPMPPTTRMKKSRAQRLYKPLEPALRLDDTIDSHKKMLPFRPATTGLSRDLTQKFEKMRTDLNTAASSLDRLSTVVTSQMEVQLKSTNELSRMSVLLIEHDEKIAAMTTKISVMDTMQKRHDEILSHRGMDSLVTTLGGGLLGFCFSAASFFLYTRKRPIPQSAMEIDIDPTGEMPGAFPHTGIVQDQVTHVEAEQQIDDHHLDFAKATKLVRMA